jgi:hypothetical protein
MSHAMSIDSTDGSFFASYDEMPDSAVLAQAKSLGISTKGKTKQQMVQEILKAQRKAKSSKKPEKKPESKSSSSSSKKKNSHSKKPQRGDPRFVQGLANSGLLG